MHRRRSGLRHIVLLGFTLSAGACSPEAALDRIRSQPRTAHDRYAEALRDAGLDSTALGQEWLAASDSALRAPLVATLPAREIGVYTRDEARAVAYRMSLRDGERMRATLRADGMRARIYLDLFEVTGDTAAPFHHRATSDTLPLPDSAATFVELTYEARRTGDVVLRLQPELLRAGRYTLEMRTEPILAFPVEGGTNTSIQSFFGAVRDGGRRDHHGIDIFAPRGTPVLAATDGIVRSISPNQLGGNVVWQSDPARGQSLYYAHLDRHHVAAGQRVREGDTLGFVGNTGNARTTSPHLHFGIYRRGSGPVDPLHHVRRTTAVPPEVAVDASRLGRRAQVGVATADLRAGPATGAPLIQRLTRATPFRIMAANSRWYRVQFENGRTGYLAGAVARIAPDRPPVATGTPGGGIGTSQSM